MRRRNSFLIALAWAIVVFSSNAGPLEPWLSVTPQPLKGLRGVTFGNGLFVAVGGNGTILTSTDGASWTPRTSGSDQVDFYAATFGDNGFVAVGGTRENSSQPVVWTSPDAVWWTPRDVSYLNMTFGNTLQGVTFGNGLYVAVGGNPTVHTISTSPDGVHWTARYPQLSNPGLFPLGGVAYGNGVFVAVGPVMLTSTNGIVWTQQDSSAWYVLYGITHAAGRFVAVGPYSRICSTNGTNWLIGGPPTAEYLNGVTYGDGSFVCVGNSSSYSANGLNWTLQNSGVPGSAVAFGNGVFVAVGGYTGAIYRTMVGLHLSPQAGTVAQVTLTGLIPGTCRIEAKQDIGGTNTWSVLDTIPFTNSPTTWTDWSSANESMRFYRAVWTP